MTRLLSHLFRFIVVIIAYIAAVLSASAFMLFLLWGGLTRGDADLQQVLGVAAGFSLPVVAAFVSYYAFMPMMLVIAIAEIGGRRSWLFHALAGLAVGGSALVFRANSGGLANPHSGLLMVALAAGAVGGTTYWLVAGRNSGRHLDQLADDLTSRGSSES